jgi:hypothetical protein
MTPDFDKAIQAICDCGVEFVVIGGLAATLHGSAYVTFDLDICYSRDRANVARLALALAPFHPRPRGFPANFPFIWDEKTLQDATVLTLPTDIGDIDLLAEVAGVGEFTEVKANSVLTEAFERKFALLGLRSLIRAKRASGRPKDLAVLHELESLLEAREP